MLLRSRKHRSQREKAPVRMTFWPNADGAPHITLRDDEGTWYMLEPENEDEMKRLLSEAHIIHHNWPAEADACPVSLQREGSDEAG